MCLNVTRLDEMKPEIATTASFEAVLKDGIAVHLTETVAIIGRNIVM